MADPQQDDALRVRLPDGKIGLFNKTDGPLKIRTQISKMYPNAYASEGAITGPESAGTPEPKAESPSVLDTLKREGGALAGAMNPVSIGKSLYSAATAPDEGIEKYMPPQVTLAKRLLYDPVAEAAKWYAGNAPDKASQALDVAPEAVGAGAGNALLTGVPGAAESLVGRVKAGIAPEIGSRLASGATTIPKVPGEVGTIGGALSGEAAGHPWLGAMVGRAATGLLNRVTQAASPLLGRILKGSGGGPELQSPLEPGTPTVPSNAPPTPSAAATVPPLAEATQPTLESPLLRGAPGRPPTQGPVAPPLQEELQPALESPGVSRAPESEAAPQATLQERVQEALRSGIVPGNADTDISTLPPERNLVQKPVLDMVGAEPEGSPTAPWGIGDAEAGPNRLELMDEQHSAGIKERMEQAGAEGGHPAREGLREGLGLKGKVARAVAGSADDAALAAAQKKEQPSLIDQLTESIRLALERK